MISRNLAESTNGTGTSGKREGKQMIPNEVGFSSGTTTSPD